jgi:predicted transposase YbfD/YdcC
MTTFSARLGLPNQALLFDLEALYACLQQVPDRRKRRGVRYPLAALLMIGVLAKLAGQDSSRAMAHWANLRKLELSRLFELKRQSMPHASTWSRILGHGVPPEEIEQVLRQFFTREPPARSLQRGSVQLSLDGKTLRGTIPAGQTQGVHLMAAYLPEQGVVLMQMQVGDKTNEITAAPQVVQALDLRGVVVTGDAMHAQRTLSVQILEYVIMPLSLIVWLVEAIREAVSHLLLSNIPSFEAFHRLQAPAGDDRSGHLVECVPAFKAAMCGNGPCKQVVHVFLL